MSRKQKIPPRQTKEDFWGTKTAKVKKIIQKEYPIKKQKVITETFIKKEEANIKKQINFKEEVFEEIIYEKVIIKKVKKSYFKSKSRLKSRIIKDNIKKCEKCLRSDILLEVHHIDGNAMNNDTLNLKKLCCLCHYNIHKDEPVGRIMRSRIIKMYGFDI